jgi:hypothetical protein
MRHSHRIWWLLLVSGALACVLVAGDRWASVAGRAGADRNAALLARAHLGLLTSELQKFRLLPLVLAEYPDIVGALSGGGPAAVHRANETLALLAERTDAAVLYAIDAHGRAVAASNWDRPTSFVGQDYTFRRYFNEAMVRGGSELFALGTVSGRPGLYLARRSDRGQGRVRPARGSLGAIAGSDDRHRCAWRDPDNQQSRLAIPAGATARSKRARVDPCIATVRRRAAVGAPVPARRDRCDRRASSAADAVPGRCRCGTIGR